MAAPDATTAGAFSGAFAPREAARAGAAGASVKELEHFGQQALPPKA
jgi:hypothetical protein